MKSKKEIFISRVNKNGKLIEGMDSPCWEFSPKNSNYKGVGKLSFQYEKGKTASISLCGFLFFNGKFPESNVYTKCHNKLCVNPSHFIDDYCMAHFGEYIENGIRYKPCPICKNIFPKTKEYFYFMGDGTLTSCKSCVGDKVKVSRAKNWARQLYYEIKRRNKATGIEVTFDDKFILELFDSQNGRCYWTGLEMIPSVINKYPFQPSLDRLDNSRGYTEDNVVLCCLSMNMGRNSVSKATFEEFVTCLKNSGINTEMWK